MEIQLATHDVDYSKSIDTNYNKPSQAQLAQLRAAEDVAVIVETSNIKVINSYYQDDFAGARDTVLTRTAIYQRLQAVADLLAPNYGLLIFDVFRSIRTQQHLFDTFCQQINEEHPNWSAEAIKQEARKFAADPNATDHYPIPPHNSGGAVDLAIFATSTDEMCPFGSAFDELSSYSATSYFEQPNSGNDRFTEAEWLVIRNNRRVLFNLMKQAGFVNFVNEWWHYDLGDCLWADTLGIDWVFDSMEDKAMRNLWSGS